MNLKLRRKDEILLDSQNLSHLFAFVIYDLSQCTSDDYFSIDVLITFRLETTCGDV